MLLKYTIRVYNRLMETLDINTGITKENKNYNALDLVKFILAFFVVAIHIDPFSPEVYEEAEFLNYYSQQLVCRLAVPFYFAVSGFLVFAKIDIKNPDSAYIKKYCFKILRLLGTWFFLLYAGGKYQLWYMGAVVLAVVLIYMMLKIRLNLIVITIVSVVCYSIGVLGDSYQHVLAALRESHVWVEKIAHAYEVLYMDNTRNGVLFGLLFVVIGVILAKKKIKIPLPISIAGAFVSFLAMTRELVILRNVYELEYCRSLIFMPVCIFFLLQIFINLDLKGRLYKSIRVWGNLIFYMHLIVCHFIKLFADKYELVDVKNHLYLYTIIYTTAIAIVIELLSRKRRWLRYLYS